MKKILFSTAFAFLMFQGISAQTIHPHYQDGKIWFRVKDDYRIQASLNENTQNLSFGTLPFLENITRSHAVTRLSRPFFAAKTSAILQRTFLLTFNDAANVENIIQELNASGAVVYAERVPLDKTCLVPNDPSYSSEWHLSTINAAKSWKSNVL